MVASNRKKKVLFFYIPEITGATKVSQYIQKCIGDEYFTSSYTCLSADKEYEITQALSQFQPDIVFCSFICLSPYVIKVAHEVGNIKIIIRNDYLLKDTDDSLLSLLSETYPFVDVLIAQTKQMISEIESKLNIPTSKIYLLPNPIDTIKIKDLAEKDGNPFPNDGCFHYLWVGRKDPIKDVETLVKAFHLIKIKYPQSTLTLITNNTNPYRWMKHADCFVLSSKSEACPNVLKEVLFLQVPVISTKCSAIVNELIKEGRNGYTIEVGNEIMMAKAMADVRDLHFIAQDLLLPTIEDIKLLFNI